MAQDQIIFKVPAEKKRALKMQCVARGVTMTNVLVQAIDRILDGQAAKVADLVTAVEGTQQTLNNLTVGFKMSEDVRTILGNELENVRTALAPFQEVE